MPRRAVDEPAMCYAVYCYSPERASYYRMEFFGNRAAANRMGRTTPLGHKYVIARGRVRDLPEWASFALLKSVDGRAAIQLGPAKPPRISVYGQGEHE